jgi:hypothetical protein
MNAAHLTFRLFIACLAALAVLPQTTFGQDVGGTKAVIPTIQMDNVPLTDAIRNLARQAQINYILDPALSDFSGSSGGQKTPVTLLWTNLTAEQALSRLLKQSNLSMVLNPSTSVARIAFTNQAVNPVPASLVGADTNPVIPLIVMDFVPLSEAIKQLARQAQLRVYFDAKASAMGPDSRGRMILDQNVSIRWTNVTARQALAALLDNYGLAMQEDPAAGSATITAREAARPGSARKPSP